MAELPGDMKLMGGSSLAELVGQRELLWNLTLRELRSKYKRSALGWLWSLLNPLSSIVIYSVVFGALFHMENPEGNPSHLKSFTLWLTCALLPWNFLATAVGTSTGALVGNAGLLKKVYLPREYIVASNVFSWLVSFLIEMTVLSIGFLFAHHVVFAWLPLVVVLAIFQTIFVLGISLALSVINVYFRDVQHLIGIALQIWFYLTPVVYSMEKYISTSWRQIYELNPLVHFMTAYRNLLFDGRLPGLRSMAYIVISSLLSLAIGTLTFRRLEPRMVEEL